MVGTQYLQLSPGLAEDQVREVLCPARMPLALHVCLVSCPCFSVPQPCGVCFVCF